jgi:hypothetical protein
MLYRFCTLKTMFYQYQISKIFSKFKLFIITFFIDTQGPGNIACSETRENWKKVFFIAEL